ncbi:MAG: hypothetical protein LBR91_03810 [Puniceicoccales bacterium]|jgi:phosphoglucosamine mutase|nr:hypothetical protein [Puniceicoccales bacterium]
MKYFGTDGIRGKFGEFPISGEFFENLAHSIEKFFLEKYSKRTLTVCIGMDTRASGIQLFQSLLCGFSKATKVLDCGILPTPAVAEATIFTKSDAGMVITASHNPSSDNGVKIFTTAGEKLTVEWENELEEIVENARSGAERECEVVDIHEMAEKHYCAKFTNSGISLDGTIVLDSANGATSRVAKRIFGELAKNVIQIGDAPNGHNINDGYGSEHPETLAATIKKVGAFVGIASDGDGDRVVILDENGEKIDGDVLIGTIAAHMVECGELANGKIVATIQSNRGLDRYLKTIGVSVIRCAIGDRNVYQEMLKNDCYFGGESSGHLIFRKFSPIGDSITAAIYLLTMAARKNIKLSKLKTNIALLPQKSFNIAVSDKVPISEIKGLGDDVERERQTLGPGGRIIARYSGTEPKLRVTVESDDVEEVDHAWERLQKSILTRFGENDISATIS